MSKAVSDEMIKVIKELMAIPELSDFYLGGGTNLAIKYNHRVSTDIDLFSSKVVSLEDLNKIVEVIESKYHTKVKKNNFINEESAHLSWIQLVLNGIKVEIIQNLQLRHPIEEVEGMRLINDKDIGALKLYAAAGRGTQKDFYDLHLLCNKYSFEEFYKSFLELEQERKQAGKPRNIFELPGGSTIPDFTKDLSSLVNFENTGDKRNNPGNRIKAPKGQSLTPWFTVRTQWTNMIKQFARERNLEAKEKRPVRNATKNRGFSL